MRSDSNPMQTVGKRGWSLPTGRGAMLASLMAAATAGIAAASTQTYSWSAELVELDAATSTAAVQALLAGHADLDELPELSEDDRVTITWSGLTRGTAIRGISRNGEVSSDALALSAEYVSTQGDDRYIVFRVAIPEDSFERLSSLSPGDWVTLTSPRGPAGWDEAVVEARPYNDVG